MRAYSLGTYSFAPRIWDLAGLSLAWGPTAWGPTVSRHGFGIWRSTHLHGGLHPGGVQSRALDLGSGEPLTCMRAYSLEAYSLAPRIWDLANLSLAWGPTAWGPTVSGHGFEIWQSIYLHEGL